ncbi:MAG: glycosyltransferase [Acidobacteriales bacterium]|nr:glycosyltransferase [Terriglobales bacterium]
MLELGAGDGTWTAVLASQLRNENQITGAVFSEELFKVALSRDIPCARFMRITNLSRDLVSHSFDYVVGSMMLFHELLPEMLFAIHRLLKPGGQILFFEHNHRHPGRRLASRLKPGERGNGGLFPYITDQRVLKTCSHQGFTHVELAQYDFVPWGFKEGASRAVQAKAVLLEHAPYIRVLSGGAYLWARVPGERNPVLPNLAVHEALFGSVSFVIPCHNEEQNIARLVGRILALYRPYVHELLLINDNSSDSTRRVAEQLAAAEPLVRVWNRQKPNGVGLALKDGYQLATGRFILSMDCDFVEILPEFRALFDAVAAGHEGAIGSRFSHDSILINYPFLKMVCNRLFHLIIKLFLVSRARDVSNNLKLYRAEIFKELEIESPHFSANLETGLKPLLAGFDIVEVPISWINRTVGMGTSSFKVGTVGPDYARALIRILRQHWFKRPISSIVQKPPLGASAPHPVVPTAQR